MRSLKQELGKTRHLLIWPIPLMFFGVLCLWHAWGNSNLSAEDLAIGYTDTFYQLPLLNTIFFPVLTAVLASRLCDMEIKGSMPKLLCTMQSRGSFYDFKFVHEALYFLGYVVLESLMILGMGKIYGFTEKLDGKAYAQFFVVSLCTGLLVMSIQHFLSMYFENQAASLIVGLTGSFVGLFSLYLPKEVSRWVLWSYPAAFLTNQMNWDKETREVWYTPIEFPVMKFILFLAAGMAIYILCRRIYLRKEF